MPEVRSTPPNMPPAPVIRMTEQTGPERGLEQLLQVTGVLAAAGAEDEQGHEHGDQQGHRGFTEGAQDLEPLLGP